jgi:hypothetical protein
VAVTFGLRRALTCCVQAGVGTISSAELLDGQPAGDLRMFLSTSFPNADAVETAFRHAGGSIIVRTIAGDVTSVGFSVDETQRVVLCVKGSKTGAAELRLAIPHSITH